MKSVFNFLTTAMLSSLIISFIVFSVTAYSLAGGRSPAPFQDMAVVNIGGWCSGFVAQKDIVVTARHCIDGPFGLQFQTLPVLFADQRHADFTVLASGTGEAWDEDWAILKGDTKDVIPHELAKEQPEPFTGCYSLGYGGGSPLQMQSNAVLDDGTEEGLLRLYQEIIGGDSGSALFNADTGEVIGIVVRSSRFAPLALSVPISKVLPHMPK